MSPDGLQASPVPCIFSYVSSMILFFPTILSAPGDKIEPFERVQETPAPGAWTQYGRHAAAPGRVHVQRPHRSSLKHAKQLRYGSISLIHASGISLFRIDIFMPV